MWLALVAGCAAQRVAAGVEVPAGWVPPGPNADGYVYWGAVQEKLRIRPVYPEAAKASAEEGDCVVAIAIDADGTPTCATPDPCPPDFRDSAIEAAMSSRFYPYKYNGVATAVKFRYNYHFKLD